MHRTQIALCYGTRRQVIKASVLRSRLETRYSVVAVDTGQPGDYPLNPLLYGQLGVRLGSAPAATKRRIPVVHVEAGGHPASLCDARRNGSRRSRGDTAERIGSALEPLVR
jgi:UDP-N-acetylglucosamine 2-epimerase